MARTNRTGIAAAGNWIVDHVKVIDTYPQQDTLANILDTRSGNGGAPYNVLKGLSKLGASFPLEAIGLIGDDAEGRQIIEDCAAHGILTGQLQVTREAQTSFTDVMNVRSTGRRTFFHYRGANALFHPRHIDFAASHAKIFHLGYLLLLDQFDLPDATHGTVAARALSMASEAGFTTSIDVVSEDSECFAQLVLPALRHVDYCILNEFEAGRSTGIDVRHGDAIDLAALRRAAGVLLKAGVRQWVVIHFPEGAFALDSGGQSFLQGSVCIPQEKIAGTTGAGDAFAAGVLLGLHDEKPMTDCLRFAVCAAAASLRSETCSEQIVALHECLALGDELGFREL